MTSDRNKHEQSVTELYVTLRLLEKIPSANFKLLAKYTDDATHLQNDNDAKSPHIQHKIIYLLSNIFTSSHEEIPYSTAVEKVVYASLSILDRVKLFAYR